MPVLFKIYRSLLVQELGIFVPRRTDFRDPVRKQGMKSTQDEFTNETQPDAWIRTGVSWKIAADAILAKIRRQSDQDVKIRFVDSFMRVATFISVETLLAPVYMTMSGFAVENLIKSIVLRDNPRLIDGKSGRLKKDILNHQLTRLAEQIGFIDKEDKERTTIFDKLTCFVVWAGKYPVPTRSDHYPRPVVDLELDPKQINQIFDELINWSVSKGVGRIMRRKNWADFVNSSK
jgi:hypothetical protein